MSIKYLDDDALQYLITKIKSGDITGDAGTVNGHTVKSDVPANAVFTDTTYSAATQSANGLMSATDKKKLDGTGNIIGLSYTVVSTF